MGLQWIGTAQMDKLGSPYGYDNPTTIRFIGGGKLSNDSMMYSTNASSNTLRDAEGIKFEAEI